MHKTNSTGSTDSSPAKLRIRNRILIRRYTFISLAMLFLFAVSPQVESSEEAPKPVRAELLSDVYAVNPGSSFELGVLLRVEPGWHIYWKNPGDSGLPTSVDFTVPSGFKVDEPKWPIPRILEGAGGIVDYGYEDSLLLVSRVTAPQDLSFGSEAVFKVRVSWVSCKEVCIPGRTELVLSLPVSDDVRRVNTDLFSEWRTRTPSISPSNKSKYGVEVKLTETDGAVSKVSIHLNAGNDAKEIELYPGPSESLIVGNISIEPERIDGETSITFDVKRLDGNQSRDAVLETLIVFTDGSGKRSGIVVPVELDTAD